MLVQISGMLWINPDQISRIEMEETERGQIEYVVYHRDRVLRLR